MGGRFQVNLIEIGEETEQLLHGRNRNYFYRNWFHPLINQQIYEIYI